MSPLLIGLLVLLATVLVLATGMPIAFALGAVALAFMLWFDGWQSLHFVPETVFAGLADFTLVSLPMFVIMGGLSRSGATGNGKERRFRFVTMDGAVGPKAQPGTNTSRPFVGNRVPSGSIRHSVRNRDRLTPGCSPRLPSVYNA